MATVHVIGAGVSGLAAATALAAQHVPVKLYEASSHAGGRCRSSHAPGFGMVDHGLHLVSGAAHEFFRLLARIGAQAQWVTLPSALPVIDVGSGACWHAAWYRPLPSVPLADSARLLAHLLMPGNRRVATMLFPHSPLHEQWAEPLSRLILTRPAHAASARQLQQAVWRQLRAGGGKIFMARECIQESLIGPALQRLEYLGGSAYFGQALKHIAWGADGPACLHFLRKKIFLPPDDVLILATPPHITQHWVPGLTVPPAHYAAITLHYRAEHRVSPGRVIVPVGIPADLLRYGQGSIHAMLRLAGPHWHSDNALLAAQIWRGIGKLHPSLREQPLPDWTIRREKRAGHVPLDRSPPLPALPARCLLAGDWLDARRAASLEAAAQSGHHAAAQAMALLGSGTRHAQPPQP